MLKGFKDFVMRGNIVELAIAVVIGTAFAAVVSVFVSSIIKPVISAFPGAGSSGLGFRLRSGSAATFVDLSAIINALVVFVITAAVVYFVFVVPMTKVMARRQPEPEPQPEATPELLTLIQIRDLMEAQRADLRTFGPTALTVSNASAIHGRDA